MGGICEGAPEGAAPRERNFMGSSHRLAPLSDSKASLAGRVRHARRGW